MRLITSFDDRLISVSLLKAASGTTFDSGPSVLRVPAHGPWVCDVFSDVCPLCVRLCGVRSLPLRKRDKPVFSLFARCRAVACLPASFNDVYTLLRSKRRSHTRYTNMHATGTW